MTEQERSQNTSKKNITKRLPDPVLQDCTAKLAVMRRLSFLPLQPTFLYRTDIKQSSQIR